MDWWFWLFSILWVVSGYFGWRWLYVPEQRWQLGNLFMGFVMAGFLGATAIVVVLFLPVLYVVDRWATAPVVEAGGLIPRPVQMPAEAPVPVASSHEQDRALLGSLMQKVARVQSGCDRAYSVTQAAMADYGAALAIAGSEVDPSTTVMVMDMGVVTLQKCRDSLVVVQSRGDKVLNAEARGYFKAGVERFVEISDARRALVGLGSRSILAPSQATTPEAKQVMAAMGGLDGKALIGMVAFSAAKNELGLSPELPEFQ